MTSIEFNMIRDDPSHESLNLHVIATDRPGLGLSDFQPDRRFMD
jgi:hypothetical protein